MFGQSSRWLNSSRSHTHHAPVAPRGLHRGLSFFCWFVYIRRHIHIHYRFASKVGYVAEHSVWWRELVHSWCEVSMLGSSGSNIVELRMIAETEIVYACPWPCCSVVHACDCLNARSLEHGTSSTLDKAPGVSYVLTAPSLGVCARLCPWIWLNVLWLNVRAFFSLRRVEADQ